VSACVWLVPVSETSGETSGGTSRETSRGTSRETTGGTSRETTGGTSRETTGGTSGETSRETSSHKAHDDQIWAPRHPSDVRQRQVKNHRAPCQCAPLRRRVWSVFRETL